MNILVLCYRCPWPPTTGDRIRVVQHMELLSRQHRICLLYAGAPATDEEKTALLKYCAEIRNVHINSLLGYFRCVLGLFIGRPMQVSYYKSREAAKTIREMGHIDLIYASMVRTMAWVEDSQRPVLLDFCDAFSLNLSRRARQVGLFRSALFYVESFLLSVYEKWALRRAKSSIITSELDARHIDPQGGSVSVVSNFASDLMVSAGDSGERIFKEGEFRIGFFGDMSTEYSLQGANFLARSVLPKIPAGIHLHLYFVGRDPHEDIRSLSSSSITVTGTVSSLSQYYRGMHVVVAPLFFGSGIKNRVLQAMALGRPVICTNIGNEGIEAIHGKGIWIAEREDEYVAAISELWENEELRLSLGREGQSWVEARFDRESIAGKLEAAIQKAFTHNV